MTAAEAHPPYPDQEDQQTDKLGSPELARHRLYDETPWEPRPDVATGVKKPLSSAQRRRIALLSSGPQPRQGDDILEHIDMRPLSPDEESRLHYYTKNWRHVGAEAIKNGTHKVDED